MLSTARKCRNDLKNNFLAVSSKSLPEPVALIKVTEFLREKANNKIVEPNRFDLLVLVKNIKDLLKRGNDLSELGRKDLKNLPFILPLPEANDLRAQIIKTIFNVPTNSILKREIYVYFKNYSSEPYISDLKRDIYKKLSRFSGKNVFLKTLKANIYLFGNGGAIEVQKQCKQYGFFKYFKGLKFNASLMSSNFVMVVMDFLFDYNNHTYTLEQKMALFIELIDKNKEQFQAIIPKLIEHLIIQVDSENENKGYNIDLLRNRIMGFMGDPRLTSNTANRWIRVNKRAKSIFIRWISQYDMDLFFTIIDRSLYGNAKRMWSYRKAFWNAYRDHINMIWVCFGEYAKMEIRKNKNLNKEIFYGDFFPNDKSCLIIEIGNYIFVERSHNGKLKVWRKNDCPFYIGQNSITESALTYEVGLYVDGKDGWVHASPVSYSWQKRVGAFMGKYCRIHKNEMDWRP